MAENSKPTVLYLCTRNSCRSQMAEGWLRHLAGDRFDAYSAGLEPQPVHPMAVAVMRDIGIDISHHRSKGVKEFLGRISINYAVFVCAHAEQNCPRIYPFALRRLSWPFEDPASSAGSVDERYRKFEIVRDAVGARIQDWLSEVDVP